MKPGPRKRIYKVNIEHVEAAIARYEVGGQPERAAGLREFFREHLDHNRIEQIKAELNPGYQPQLEDATRTIDEWKEVWNTRRQKKIKYLAKYLTTYDADGKRIKSVRDRSVPIKKIS